MYCQYLDSVSVLTCVFVVVAMCLCCGSHVLPCAPPLSCLCSVSHLFCSSPVPNDYPAYLSLSCLMFPVGLSQLLCYPVPWVVCVFVENNFACLSLLEGILFEMLSLQKLFVFFGVEAYSSRVPCFCVCLFWSSVFCGINPTFIDLRLGPQWTQQFPTRSEPSWICMAQCWGNIRLSLRPSPAKWNLCQMLLLG